MKKAFTLIELLIVIAIIAILALIAVPNFLEAQVRAKVSRVHGDMRSIATAIEAYAVDWGSYMPSTAEIDGASGEEAAYQALTTPVAFMTSIPRDPFTEKGSKGSGGQDDYRVVFKYMRVTENTNAGNVLCREKGHVWLLGSLGPAMRLTPPSDPNAGSTSPRSIVAGLSDGIWVYDSTNGTMSFGQIIRTSQGAYTGKDWTPAP